MCWAEDMDRGAETDDKDTDMLCSRSVEDHEAYYVTYTVILWHVHLSDWLMRCIFHMTLHYFAPKQSVFSAHYGLTDHGNCRVGHLQQIKHRQS